MLSYDILSSIAYYIIIFRMSQSLVLELGRSVGAHEGPSPGAVRRVSAPEQDFSVSHPMGDAQSGWFFEWETHGKPHGKYMDDLGLASFWETKNMDITLGSSKRTSLKQVSRAMPKDMLCQALIVEPIQATNPIATFLYILPLQSKVCSVERKVYRVAKSVQCRTYSVESKVQSIEHGV